MIYKADSKVYPNLKLEVDFQALLYRFIWPQPDGSLRYGMYRAAKSLEIKDNMLLVVQILWSGDLHKSAIKLIDAAPESIIDGF